MLGPEPGNSRTKSERIDQGFSTSGAHRANCGALNNCNWHFHSLQKQRSTQETHRKKCAFGALPAISIFMWQIVQIVGNPWHRVKEDFTFKSLIELTPLWHMNKTPLTVINLITICRSTCMIRHNGVSNRWCRLISIRSFWVSICQKFWQFNNSK